MPVVNEGRLAVNVANLIMYISCKIADNNIGDKGCVFLSKANWN